jgi:uracil-DNA glycosylase family 4
MASRDDILRELKLVPLWVRTRSDVQPRGAETYARSDDLQHSPSQRAGDSQPAATLREPASPGFHARPLSPTRQDATDPARVARIGAMSLDELAADARVCTACGLCKSRKLAVPGVGDPAADWLFIGEAPGAEEDARGEPFVGQAGRLLDNMLAALGLSRTHKVYIANVLKCRPPNNRTPEPAETAACQPYLLRQIELIAPRIIVALGKSAATLLLGQDASIASLRGRVHRYGDVPLVVTYHPAYLLRSLPEKAKAWEDLLLARRAAAA